MILLRINISKEVKNAATIYDFSIGRGRRIYKGLGKTVNEIPGDELTVTMMRDIFPKGLFRMVFESGGTIEEKFDDVIEYANYLFPGEVLVVPSGE